MFYGQITENIKKRYNISSVKLLIYNAYVIIPSCLVITSISGELKRVSEYNQYSLGFFFYLGLSCSLTAVLNASYFISNEKNSSLFTQLCANCSDIFVTAIGFHMIGDFVLSIKTCIGILCTTFGATVFSIKTLYNSIRGVSSKSNNKELKAEKKE